MTLNESIKLYYKWRQSLHLAEGTIKLDKYTLNCFAVFCFAAWLENHKGSHRKVWSKNHRNRHIWTAKDLFRFLFEHEYILTDITLNLPQLNREKTLPRGVMTKEQVALLLRQPNLSTPNGFRDRTILELLYSCGLRNGELCRLTPYDIDLQERIVTVLQGKGCKDRHVPLGKMAKQYLAEYLKTVRPLLINELKNCDGSLFMLTPSLLRQVMVRNRNKAGLSDTFTIHSLRHTCATEMLRGGASIRHIQEMLGHASLVTTQIYTRVVIDDLQKAHKKTAPSERRTQTPLVSFNPETAAWRQNKPKRKKRKK